MKDTSGAQVLGRTSLKRLGIVMVPTVIAAGALTVLMANGAIAVSFAISGQTAQMTVGELQGKGFAQYGGIDKEANGTEVQVAVSAFKSATISNGLCQSVATDLGPLGTYTLTLTASGGTEAQLATRAPRAIRPVTAGLRPRGQHKPRSELHPAQDPALRL